jgi:PAS domain S-box-containing protein
MDAWTRWMKTVIPVLLFAFVFGGGWFYHVQKQTIRQMIETNLSAVARLKADQIAAWREERLQEAAVLQEDPFLNMNAANFLAEPANENAMDLRAYFDSIARHWNYNNVLLTDLEGNVRLSLREQVDANFGETSVIANAVRDQKPALSDLHMDAQHPTPHISVVAPLFTGKGQTPEAVGAVILVCDASRLLFPLIQFWPTPTKTAETLLVTRDNDYVLFLNDLRHMPGTALQLRIPLNQTDVPAVMAANGRQGVFEGKDYRGVKVLSAILPVPNSPWFMIAKIDAAEAFVFWRWRAIFIIGLFASLVGMTVVFGLFAWQREKKNRYLALYRSEAMLRATVERHSVTLKSIGDAVISTDALGRVELLNAVAEKLTGWSDKEARGRPLEEVFRIVNEFTRESIEDPAARVLREGLVVGLGNHTLLLSRDGTEYPIADSGAPLRADDGTLSGVVLVFRDQTEERMAQKLAGMRLALTEYAASHAMSELLCKILDEIGALVDSPIGFYHFVESDQKTISLQQWSTRTLEEFCRAEFDTRHYDISRAGVWANCVLEKKPVIHNDYPSLEHKKGMPNGHAELIRELTVPVMREGRVVAIVGIGNKPVDYMEKDARIVASFADMTWEIVGRKRAEEARREREKIYGAIINQAAEGIALVDLETLRVVEFNDAACNGLGYSREEFAQLHLFDVQGRLTREEFADVIRKLEETGHVHFENRQRRKDGSMRDVLVSKQVIVLHDRRYMVALWLDITDLKQSDRSLRESEERYRVLFEGSPHGVVAYDSEFKRFVFANPSMCRMLGYTETELLELGIGDVHPRTDLNFVVSEFESLVRGEQNLSSDIPCLRKDGTLFYAQVAAALTTIRGRKYYVGFFTDITERRKAEEESEKLQAQLNQAQKMESVGRLAGGVAHDFNNMLGVIIGRADIALLRDVSPQVREDLTEILKAGRRSAALTRQLLAFARQQTAEPKLLDLNDTISGMFKMLRRLIREDIDLSWMPGMELWQVKIDPIQVDQVLVNLLVNAGDAISGSGAIIIKTENVFIEDSSVGESGELAPGDYVLLSVSDTGTGMSREVREKAFEPFFTTKELGKGTGLGLSTVYGIIKQNDGFIYVESKPREGATFKIYLPRSEDEAAAAPSGEAGGERRKGTETILLVEDDEAILNLSRMILESLGYAVIAAHTPLHAIQLAEEHTGNIRLLLTDVVMPGMNGRELLETLRVAIPGLKHLFMSGYTADVIAHRGVVDEGVNFIQKPFRIDDLATKVRQVLDNSN